jgi:hypothetical protein
MASALFRHGLSTSASCSKACGHGSTSTSRRSVEQLKGSLSQANVADPLAFARANDMQMLVNFTSLYDWREIQGASRPEGRATISPAAP